MKRKGKVYQLTIYATSQTVREAIKGGYFLSATQLVTKDLPDAIGVEYDPPEWSDEEEAVPEMGFKAPKRPQKRKKGRK